MLVQSTIHPLAGKPAPPELLVNIPQLITAYYTETPDPEIKKERVTFGTSGHRGNALDKTFNEAHILAITYAIILYRKEYGITGPLFLGIDTHALSVPAFTTAMEVLAAYQVQVIIAKEGEYVPTPVISYAILAYNHQRKTGFADGIVITPSHNPPHDGGFKYNPPAGGAANTAITHWIESKANAFLAKTKAIKRKSIAEALKADTTSIHDFLSPYVNDLAKVINMQAIAQSDLHIGVNPLGGAGLRYWERIAEDYHIGLHLLDNTLDPSFRFMTLDWDGQIRMDPSSPYAMAGNLAFKDKYDLILLCDTDYDRHGIICPTGLMTPNHYLCSAIAYLFGHRPEWPENLAIGKTVVSSQMIDRIALGLQRKLYEVPVGFKWFSEGLLEGALGFAGEESAGASFLRQDANVWTTDKDGLICTLLAAEMTAVCGKNPAELYQKLEQQYGRSFFIRIDSPINPDQKVLLKQLSPDTISLSMLAGEPIQSIITKAPANAAPIDGIKIASNDGWFVVRPSGTENIYKLYAESFKNEKHLMQIVEQAQQLVEDLLKI